MQLREARFIVKENKAAYEEALRVIAIAEAGEPEPVEDEDE